jgi:Fe-S-cluster containining protein
MSELMNASGNGHEAWDNLRDEVAGGLRYAHTRANANTGKLLEVASFAYAAIELLAEKGLLPIEALDERKKVVAGRLVEKFANQGMGVVYQQPEHNKYTFDSEVRIDCENRVHLCKAACCRLRFALSKQDVEEGTVKWDFARPYLIARGADGYCQHLDRGTLGCTIHAQRPVPCRAYDCRGDKRIWADFENKIVSPELEKLFRTPEELETDDANSYSSNGQQARGPQE